MTNIAELGIRVDSGDAVQAATDLEKMTKAGERAEQSAVGLMNEMQALETSLSAGAKTTQELAKQRESLARLTKTGAYGEAEFLKISAQLDKQQQALVKSTMDEQKALVSLLGSVDPAQAALAKLDKQVEDLGKHLDAGRISQVQYNEALKKLDGKYAEIEKTSSAFSNLGLHTKGARENVLQLGNALASGNLRVAAHNILEIGNSAGASALRLAAVAAPIAAVSAAVVGLGYAYYKGSKEADAYNKSLVLTGSYAGVTADQLSAMARQASATVGSTGAAAAVLATLAGNGKIASESFESITQAALSMNEATGKAVSDTVSEFVKLADDPVKASAALNEQYHYLTASVYSQIVALEKQGDHAGAVKLATEQYADAINERTPKILENLSWWEKGYNLVARAADRLKEIGRPDIDLDIYRAEQDLQRAESGDIGLFQNRKRMVEYYTDRLAFLKDEKAAKEEIAKLDSDSAKAELAGQKAILSFDARSKATRSNTQKRADELKDLEKEIADLRAVDPSNERLTQASIDAQKAAINAKYKDPKGTSSPVDLTEFNGQKNALTAILAEYKNHRKELDAAQKAGLISQESYAAQRAAIIEQQKAEVTNAYEAEIKALEGAKGRSSTSAQQRIQLDQKIADARAAMVKAQKDADTELSVLATNEQGRLAKQTAATQAYVDQLERQRAALSTSGRRAANNLGLGDRQQGLQRDLDGVTDRFNDERAKLLDRRRTAPDKYSQNDYERDLAILGKAEDGYRDTVVENYDKISEAQGDWRKGASSAFQNYLDQARDVAGQTKSLFTNAFTSMEDAVVNFAITGKGSFADFTKSILADMARIAARQAASGLLGNLVNFGVSAATSYFGGGTTSAGSTQAGYSPEVINSWAAAQADGGAWSNGVQLFANGGAFTNSIVSTPTAFGMAGGKVGVMGEAGDEAIMPLTRTAGGQLGVMAVGGGGGTSISLSAPVSIITEDRSGEGMKLDQALLRQNMQKQVQIAAEKAVADSWRPGGISHRNTQGRR
ncbi:phage tail tape measure protein [Pseudomonas sp. DC418]|uniref:phage tail tape measure protein n=1 Tax=Pseudomonas sp. DC418 TaxID=3418478 RepID=UPI003D2A2A02